jgi:ribosomal protein L18E
MAKSSKLDEIEQTIFTAKTEKEKEMWRKIKKRLEDNPPPRPKTRVSRKS